MKNKKLFYGIVVIIIIFLGIFLASVIFQNENENFENGNETIKNETETVEKEGIILKNETKGVEKKNGTLENETKVVEKEEKIPTQGFMPKILIAHSKGLTELIYDDLTQKYLKQAYYNLSNPTAVAILEDSVFVTTGDSIIRLNSSLEKEKESKTGEFGSLAASDKNIFVSANGSFIIIDKDLKRINGFQLDTYWGGTKNAHDILVHNGTAYLLDNVQFPIWIFRVNIENPKHIKIQKIEVWGTNQHLDGHWLNPELNQWLIIQSYGVQWKCGITGGQIVQIYPLGTGKGPIAREEIFGAVKDYYEIAYDKKIVNVNNFERDCYDIINVTIIKPQEVDLTIRAFSKQDNVVEDITLDKDKISYLVNGLSLEDSTTVEVYSNEKLIYNGSIYREKGFRIMDITDIPPTWAVVMDKKEKYFLAQVNTENNSVSFSNFFDLKLKDGYVYGKKFVIKQSENYLFITSENSLIVVDVEQQPKIFLSQEIENIDSIRDFALIK